MDENIQIAGKINFLTTKYRLNPVLEFSSKSYDGFALTAGAALECGKMCYSRSVIPGTAVEFYSSRARY